MLETRAIVVRLYGKEALVESKGGLGCGNCSPETGCSSGKLSQLFCSKPRQFTVQNQAQAQIGDEVQITLPEGVLLRSAMLMYGLPLSFLLCGGMFGAYWARGLQSEDGYAALGALVGLIAGFALAKWLSRYQRVFPVTQVIICRGTAGRT